MQKFIAEIRGPLLGWIHYFRLAEVKRVFEELAEWIRRRLRAILWRQWQRPVVEFLGLAYEALYPAFAGRTVV